MKRNITNAIIACLILLSPALSRAEEYVHNFSSMSSTSELTFEDGNKTGVTDLVTYTCSGGSATFGANKDYGYEIEIFMEGSGAQVVTSPVIDALDSIRISYRPAAYRSVLVSISTDGSSWTDVDVITPVNGVKNVKLPNSGPYQVRIKRDDANFYVTEIKYITKPCHCLKVVNNE